MEHDGKLSIQKKEIQKEIEIFKSANGSLSSIPKKKVYLLLDKISNILGSQKTSQQTNNLDTLKSESSTVQNKTQQVAGHSSNQLTVPSGNNSTHGRRNKILKRGFKDNHVQPEEGEMTDEQKEAIKQVATNPLLIQAMIDQLDLIDLLPCRRVNRNWKFLTTKLILDRNCTVITLDYNDPLKSFGKCPQAEEMSDHSYGRVRYNLPAPPPRHRLKTLNKILEKSSAFPCTNFAFLNESNRTNESLLQKGGNSFADLDKFFKIQGQSINTLKLVNFSNEDVKQVLTRRTPDLKILEVLNEGAKDLAFEKQMEKFSKMQDEDYVTSDEEQEESDDDDQLLYTTKLTTLNFDASVDLFPKIVKASPNLSLIQIPRIFGLTYYMDVLVRTRRIKLIKKMEVNCSRYNEQFCGNGPDDEPRLEKLGLYLFVSQFDKYCPEETDHAKAQQMLPLLECNRNTLLSLDLSIIGHFDIDELPSFPRLKKLKVGDGSEYKPRQCFPIETNLNLLCPNLQTLDCTGFNCLKDSAWRKQFPDGSYSGNFSGVMKLKISDCCTDLWFHNLQNLCPNFKNVVVRHNEGNNRLQKLLPQIFKFWTHLESLKIKIEDPSVKGEEKICGLDSTLTGLSEKTCDVLAFNLFVDAPQRTVKRPNPSLLDLTELKLLEFQLRTSYAHEVFVGNDWSHYFLTEVTGAYAFKLMPQLCVKFQFDHNCKDTKVIKRRLQPIADYINLTHRKLLHD